MVVQLSYLGSRNTKGENSTTSLLSQQAKTKDEKGRKSLPLFCFILESLLQKIILSDSINTEKKEGKMGE